jgi:amino acid transporter
MPENKEDLRLEMKDDYLLRHTVDSIYYPHNDLNYESTISHLSFTLSVIGLLVTTFFALAFIFILYYDKNSDEITNLTNDIEELPWFIPHIVLAIIVPIIYHIQVPWLSILQPMLFGILYLVFIYLISLCIRVIYYSRHKKIQR